MNIRDKENNNKIIGVCIISDLSLNIENPEDVSDGYKMKTVID